MTNNELIEIINRRIDEYTDNRIKRLEELETDHHNKYEHIEALKCRLCQYEDETMRMDIKSELNDLLQSLDLNADYSIYKEMWEELKSKIKSKKKEREQDERYYRENKYYYFAAEQCTKQLENVDTLCQMESIEKKRGI